MQTRKHIHINIYIHTYIYRYSLIHRQHTMQTKDVRGQASDELVLGLADHVNAIDVKDWYGFTDTRMLPCGGGERGMKERSIWTVWFLLLRIMLMRTFT